MSNRRHRKLHLWLCNLKPWVRDGKPGTVACFQIDPVALEAEKAALTCYNSASCNSDTVTLSALEGFFSL